jgi:hypothetical protein
MKKTLMIALGAVGFAGSFCAYAADTVCSGAAAAGPGTKLTAHTAGTNFTVVDVSPKCSANVNLTGVDGTNGAWYAVGSNSVKGKNSFGANTNGGSVAITGACAIPGGCTSGEADTARDTANTAAASTT